MWAGLSEGGIFESAGEREGSGWSHGMAAIRYHAETAIQLGSNLRGAIGKQI